MHTELIIEEEINFSMTYGASSGMSTFRVSFGGGGGGGLKAGSKWLLATPMEEREWRVHSCTNTEPFQWPMHASQLRIPARPCRRPC